MKRVTLPPQTEKSFQRQVLQLAKLQGWRTAHFRTALTQKGQWITAVQGDGKGWPDLVLVRGARLIVAELKTDTGRLTLDQSQWLDALQGTPAEVYVWKPRDWDDIVRALKQGAFQPTFKGDLP